MTAQAEIPMRASASTVDVVALAVPIVAAVFFLAFWPTEISDNSVGYVLRVGDERHLFYAPHLLHAFFIKQAWLLLSQLSSCGVICAGQVVSAAWGVVAVTAMYVLVRTLLNSVGAGLLGALALMVSHGFWIYATQLEVYVPVVGSLTALAALLLTSPSAGPGSGRLLACAALWAVAVLYHLGNVGLFLPLLFYFASAQGWRGLRQLVPLCAVAGGIVLLCYGAVYLFTETAPPGTGFLQWVLGITSVPMTDWGSVSNWGLTGLRTGFGTQIHALTLVPEGLFSDDWELNQRPLRRLGAALVIGLLIWNLVCLARKGDGFRTARGYLILWFAVSFVFFTWWEPDVHKFFIPSFAPLVPLAALALRDLYAILRPVILRRALVAATIAGVAAVFLLNVRSALELRGSLGPDYAEAQFLDRVVPPSCRIYEIGHRIGPLELWFARNDVANRRAWETEFYWRQTATDAPSRFVPTDEACGVVRLGYLARAYVDTFSAYLPGDLDRRWHDYLAWMLDVRPDTGSGGITYSAFRLMHEGDGPPLVFIDRSQRRDATGIDEIAAIVDGYVEDAYAQFGPAIWRIPSAQVPVKRLRLLIFGYASGDFGTSHGRPGVFRAEAS